MRNWYEVEKYYYEVKEENVEKIHLYDQISEEEVDKIYHYDGMYIGLKTLLELLEVNDNGKKFRCLECDEVLQPEHLKYIDYITHTKLCELCIEDYLDTYYLEEEVED